MDMEQMALRCPTAKFVGTSKVNGYELLFKGSLSGAYATIEKRKGSTVPVVIWKIEEQDEANLDRYEGYPIFYYKKSLAVEVEGERLNAMVYIMDERRELGKPSERYYKTLELAYEKFGFDRRILELSLAKSTEKSGSHYAVEPEKEIIERLKREYPKGTRIELIRMNDLYTKLNAGDKGTVIGVDDIGTIHVNWDRGSSIGIVFGVDACRKIRE